MFIKSQNKKLLVNTDNIAAIFCTDLDEIKVLYNFYGGADPIGRYDNNEQVDTTMQYISDCLEDYNANIVFPMPSVEEVTTE